MKLKRIIVGMVLISICSSVTQVKAQVTNMPADHIMVMPNNIKWVDNPPGLPTGSKFAVIEGDPREAGLFTMRVKIPAGYKIMPHWHPADEHITVLEGSCFMGLGDKIDEKAVTEMMTDAFAVMKTGTHHFFFAKKECIVQLHGIGPWGITYVNPADDPRSK